MRRDLAAALNLALDNDVGDHRRDLEPAVIALVDRRGRRLLVPTGGALLRHRRHAALGMFGIAPVPQSGYTSGTIH